MLVNLLVNAAHAGGTVTLRTRVEDEYVRLSVIDTGAGIPPHVAERVFDPFFTTKELGRGTGQGLAIARRIVVDGHGGTLTFDTEPGAGTTFHVKLPVLLTVRRTQAERRAETERRVLDATMAIIASDGVRAVTMAAVGEAAGYSRGIVNHQFGTRQALMAAVAETVQSRFSPDPGGRDRARARDGDGRRLPGLTDLQAAGRARLPAPVDRRHRRRGARASAGVPGTRRALPPGHRAGG